MLFLRGMNPMLMTSDEFQEELRQECLVVLLKDRSMLAELMGRKPLGIIRVRQVLLRQLIELSRSGENKDIQKDTWRLFYRHVQGVLRKSDQFNKNQEDSRKNYYSRTPNPLPSAVTTDDLMDIVYPSDLPLEFTELNKKENILKAAGYFWASAAECAGVEDISISINDFINWLGRSVDIQQRVVSGSGGGDNDELPGIIDTCPGSGPFDDSKKRTLSVWAQKCFNFLNDKEKRLFFYFFCKNLTHDAVSKLMGKKSNMDYPRKKMIHKLQSFLSPLDWVSPDKSAHDMIDAEDLDFFRFELCTTLDTWNALQEKE